MKSLLAVLILSASSVAYADHYIHTSTAQADHRWGIGLRTASQGLENDSDDDRLHLGGGGLHVRWRFAPKWSAELTMEGLKADLYDGAYQRELDNSTLTFGYHFTPYSRWDLAILAGIGGTDDTVTYRKADGTMAQEVASEVNFQLGFAVERRWTHFGIGLDFRAIGYARTDEEDQPEDYDSTMDFRAIPSGQSAGQLNLHATYYF
jgi:hypothetical protein